MDTVALAATIGGSLVGLAGVVATGWGASQQRELSRELAAAAREHERRLAQGQRLFDLRVAAYESMLNHFQMWWEQIVVTEPIIEVAGQPDPPVQPSVDEWRLMYVRLRTVGSAAVAEKYDDLSRAINSFFGFVFSLRAIRNQRGGETPQFIAAWQAVDDARDRVHALHAEIERLVGEELEAL